MTTAFRFIVPLFMMAVAGYQILHPDRVARRKGTLEWRPRFMEEAVRSPTYIRYVQIIGVVVFIIAGVFLVNAIATAFGSGFLHSR